MKYSTFRLSWPVTALVTISLLGAWPVQSCTTPAESEPAVGIVESVDSDGVPLRLEVDSEAEALPDPSLIEARMNAYKASRASQPAAEMMLFAESLADGPFDPFEERNCPPEGSATDKEKMEKNRLKNRRWPPSASDIDGSVTLDDLRAPGFDRDRWTEGEAVTIEGYVNKLFATGAESCNCKVKERRLTDAHIDILAYPGDSQRPVIVEITPIWRLIHERFGWEDWSTSELIKRYMGQRVRVTGWLFYDDIHESGADNTDPKNDYGEKNWRATAWEIHPVTHIELVD